MVDFFLLGNHIFVVGAIGYCAGDFIRAFYDSITEDENATLLEVNIVFFFLSLWFLIDAIVYFNAYLATTETNTLSTLPSSASSITYSSTQSFSSRCNFLLRTELGWAYTLNIVASSGYFVTSLLPCFESYTEEALYKKLDKAQIGIDLFNMVVYTIDAGLFLHLCVKEMKNGEIQPNIAARPGTGRGMTVANRVFLRPALAYLLANICNMVASILYLCFNAYALSRRFDIETSDENDIILSGMSEEDYYFHHYHVIAREQRAMFFGADIIYLACALLLEWAWYHEEVEADVEISQIGMSANMGGIGDEGETNGEKGLKNDAGGAGGGSGGRKKFLDTNTDSSSQIGGDQELSVSGKHDVELSHSGLQGDREMDFGHS